MATKGNTAEGVIDLKLNGTEVGKTIKEIRGNLSQMYKEVNQLEIGSQAWIDKMNDIGKVEGALKKTRDQVADIKKQYADTASTAGNANKEMLNITPLGGILGEINQGWNAMQGFVQGNITRFGLLRSAIAATGIGALVLLLTGLFQYLTKTDEGAKKLEGAMNGLRYGVSLLLKPIQDLGKYLVSAFENPKKAMTDLGDFILNNLINRFKAFGVVLEGIINLDFEKVGNGVVQFGTGIEDASTKMQGLWEGAQKLAEELGNAFDAGAGLADLMDRIDEKESNLLVTNAKAEEQISRLLLQSKDRTKSEGERLALLDRASALEVKRLNESISLSQLKLQAQKIEYDQQLKTGNESDEQYRKVKEAEAEVINLRASSLELQEKITNRRNALLDAEQAQKKAMSDAEKKAQDDADKAELAAARALTNLKIANVTDENERKTLQIRNAYKVQLEDAFIAGKLTEELELELETQRDNALEALKAENKKKKADQKLAEDQVDLEAQTLAVENLMIAEEEKEQRLYELKRTAAENRLRLLENSGTAEVSAIKKAQLEITKIDSDHQAKSVELAKRTQKQKIDLEQMAYQQTASVFGDFADLLASDEESRRKYGGLIKNLKVAEIGLSGINEVAKIWEFANANPLNALIPGWGPAFAAVQTGLAIGRTGVALKKVNTTQFRKGGMISPLGGYADFGNSHEDGGIHLIDGKTGQHYGEMERKEHLMVLSTSAYSNNKPVIDALLQSSLYNNGAPIMRQGGFFENGGLVDIPKEAGDSAGGAAANNAMAMKQLEVLNMIYSSVSNWPKTVNALVVYEQMKAQMEQAEATERKANAA
jgi:hypothetical protein